MLLPSIIIILYFFVIIFDFLPIKKKFVSKKNTFIYLALLSISFCVLFLHTINITVPSPSDYIKSLLAMVLKI